MRKFFKILRFVFSLPSMPIVIGVTMWLIYKVWQNTSDVDMAMEIETNKDGLTHEINDRLISILEPFEHVLNGFCLIVWLLLIQIFIL